MGVWVRGDIRAHRPSNGAKTHFSDLKLQGPSSIALYRQLYLSHRRYILCWVPRYHGICNGNHNILTHLSDVRGTTEQTINLQAQRRTAQLPWTLPTSTSQEVMHPTSIDSEVRIKGIISWLNVTERENPTQFAYAVMESHNTLILIECKKKFRISDNLVESLI